MRSNTKHVATDRSAIEPQVKPIAQRRVPDGIAEFVAVSITIALVTLLVLLFGILTATL